MIVMRDPVDNTDLRRRLYVSHLVAPANGKAQFKLGKEFAQLLLLRVPPTRYLVSRKLTIPFTFVGTTTSYRKAAFDKYL